MTQNPAKLASCPFCGGEPILRGADAPEFWVACNGFGCKAQTEGFGSKDKAIAAWNRCALRDGEATEEATFQARVQPWMMACFGAEISSDKVERGDRLLEEVLELLQSGGYDPARVAALRDYVWSRPAGEPSQEVGGVMVTLAAYCLAHALDMHEAGETELARIWTKVDKIRAKQAAKPVGSALPIAIRTADPVEAAAPSEEPVAWTYEIFWETGAQGDGGWASHVSLEKPAPAPKVRNVRPLVFASPAVAPVADAKQKIVEFAQAILHGDDEHRGWLMGAALAFNAGDELREWHHIGTGWLAITEAEYAALAQDTDATPPVAQAGTVGISDVMVERAWSAMVGADIAAGCYNVNVVRGDIRTALEAALSAPTVEGAGL